MKRLKPLLYLLSGLLFISLLYGLNAGKILDISQKPQKADIIVVLGGDWLGFRVKKALTVYLDGFLQKNKIVVNGCQQIFLKQKGRVYRTEASYLLAHGVAAKNIDTPNICGNTMDEVEWTKRYMLEHKYRSLIIVTDPPHTRRVRMLTKIAGYSKNGIKVIFVGADVPWWNRAKYYEDMQALRYVVFETIKIPFNYLSYAVVEKLSLRPFISRHFQGMVWWMKEKITNFLNAL